MNATRVLVGSCAAIGLVIAAGAASLPACSSSSNSNGGGGGGGPLASSVPPAGPDVDPPSSVTLQPDVVVIHGGASVVKGYSSDHGVWTLDKSVSGVSSLTAGKVLLIAGLDCARITAIQDNGSTLDVTVAPVAFGDVFQEASFQWQNAAIDMTKGYVGQIPYALVVDSEAAPDGGTDGGGDSGCATSDAGSDAADGGVQCQFVHQGLSTEGLRPEGLGSNPTNSVSLNIGNWTVAWSAVTSATGGDISVTGTWMPNSANTRLPGDPAQTLGGINVNLMFTAHMQSVQGSSGSFVVHGGQITSANLNAPVGGSVDLGVQASTPMGSQFPAQALVKLPLAMEFPLPGVVPGVPFYISFQASFLVQPSLATKNATVGLSDHIDFSGNAGMNFNSGTATATGMPGVTTPANPLNNAMAGPSLGTTAAIVGVQAPRVGFGIGTMAFGTGVKAGVFVDIVNVFTLTVASSTALVPCRVATWDFASHGGGEMTISVLGTTLNVAHQIDLKTQTDPGFWYTPMVSACKP